MSNVSWNERVQAGELDAVLSSLYPDLAAARARVTQVCEGFECTFGRPARALFSAPGRTELGGNHTDHQRGCVLAAAVDLDMLAAVDFNRDGVIRVCSQGYGTTQVELEDLSPRKQEENTTAALIRGVAAGLLTGAEADSALGLDLYMVSDVPGGSGLSSSAAFEVLLGTVVDHMLLRGEHSALELAQIGQRAENRYFGKPCGLMDQTACALGGVAAIDFADPEDPRAERIGLDLNALGYALCILDSGAGHEDLTGEYAAITDELGAICRHFGCQVLRQVSEEDFLARLPVLRREAGDRAVLRAMHFYGENRRAVLQADALRAGDMEGFLELVRQSGRSSALYLQNVVPAGHTEHQELMLTIALCQQVLGHRGAVRVHGGGFGGTAQAFVPLDLVEQFKTRTEAVLGCGACRVVTVRAVGGIRLA